MMRAGRIRSASLAPRLRGTSPVRSRLGCRRHPEVWGAWRHKPPTVTLADDDTGPRLKGPRLHTSAWTSECSAWELHTSTKRLLPNSGRADHNVPETHN